jgi:hypothetical protein
MPTTDILAILALVVATLSFAVSLVTLYFQFLRKTQKLKVTLLGWFSEDIPNSESILVLNLAFANLGNQSIVLLKIGLALECNMKKRVIISAQGVGNDRLILEPSKASLPQSYDLRVRKIFFP